VERVAELIVLVQSSWLLTGLQAEISMGYQ
jgi:hypothetical protein